jgi:NAD(P)H-dependent flavin oxidoreductase YrpB (nitropropane dioxygenase family)
VTTEECDAPESYKQTYIKAGKKDIVITKSPVGMPGRAIVNPFLDRAAKGRIAPKRCYGCLEKCEPSVTPYCITSALVHAAEGKLDEALLFCGSNAWRAQRIETVEQVMKDLTGE